MCVCLSILLPTRARTFTQGFFSLSARVTGEGKIRTPVNVLLNQQRNQIS